MSKEEGGAEQFGQVLSAWVHYLLPATNILMAFDWPTMLSVLDRIGVEHPEFEGVSALRTIALALQEADQTLRAEGISSISLLRNELQLPACEHKTDVHVAATKVLN